MRKVWRNNDTLAYWNKRWKDFESDDAVFHNVNIYPIKYVDRIMDKEKSTLDAGCGLGRVVKHYHNLGYKIVGCDYSEVAVKKLKDSNPELDIRHSDIRALPYKNEEFDNILALGVFHSMEDLNDIDKAIMETIRCLKPGGSLVASVRADNLENRLIDYVTTMRGARGNRFHKWCFKEGEFIGLFKKHDLVIQSCELIANVSLLHKWEIFRKGKSSDEKVERSYGFQLNYWGNSFYRLLRLISPRSFGTTFIVTSRKMVHKK